MQCCDAIKFITSTHRGQVRVAAVNADAGAGPFSESSAPHRTFDAVCVLRCAVCVRARVVAEQDSARRVRPLVASP